VDCFPGQINQVFMNILSNAIQAISGEGRILIKSWQADDKVKISIKDTGAGMTEDVRKKIFDPFFTTKDVGKGTGLGLSISYRIIQKHNGEIEVFSKPGAGTEFLITIPIKQQLTA
jgi:two-component system, NtrC family, sensor kinase